MELFDRFSPAQINIDSLMATASREQYLTERRIVEIKEIADSAADFISDAALGGGDVVSLLALAFENAIFPSPTLNSDTLPVSVPSVKSRVSTLALYDMAEFTELLSSVLSARGISLTENSFLEEKGRKETFAYVKNPFADEAYDVFSADFADPRVVYATSFKEALGMVESGEVGYCLLPLEERGARLATIGELIFRGDFKIDSVTPVFGFDGLADMKYALLSKSFTIPKVNADDDRYLEIRVPASADADLSDILLVAKRYGVGLYRINSSIYDIEGVSELYYSIVFRDDGGDFTRLLTYLTLFCKSYTPIGIYKNLE